MKAQKSTEIDKHDVLDLEVGNSSSPRKLWGVGQQSCPPSGQPGAVQYSVISMEAADKSCQVADGSFVKEARSYTVHFSAAVTGSCGTNVYECDALPVSCSCRPDALYIRMIQQTWLYDPLANPFWAFGAVAALQNAQTVDTRTATGTNNTGVPWSTTFLGEHWITSRSGWYPTPCEFTPIEFPSDQPLTVNVVSCKPEWWKVANSTAHLRATTIRIYIPPNMWDKLVGTTNDRAAALAVSDWNTAMAGTGVTFQIVDQPCGTGGDCIRVGTLPVANLTNPDGTGSCASFTPTSVAHQTTGVITGASDMLLGEDYYVAATQARLRRTFAHELGHGLSANHNSCTIGKSLMSNVSGPTLFDACTKDTPGMAVSPTISDTTMVKKPSYGHQTRTSCGF